MSNIEPIIGGEFPSIVIPKIEQAQNSLDIVVFDWRWYPIQASNTVQRFNQAIVRALRRGVVVRVIADPPDLINRLNHLGAEARRLRHKKMVHCKYMNIDEKYVILGSHNYTQSAFHHNLELSVAIEIGPEDQRFQKFFESIWGLKGS